MARTKKMAMDKAEARRAREEQQERDRQQQDVLAIIDGELDSVVEVAVTVSSPAQPKAKKFPTPSSSSTNVLDMAREQMRYLRELQAAGIHHVDGVPIELLLSDSPCGQEQAPSIPSGGGDGFDYLDVISSPPPTTRRPPRASPAYLPAAVMVIPVAEEENDPFEYAHARLALLPPDDENFQSSSCTCKTGMHNPRTGCRYVEIPPVMMNVAAAAQCESEDADDSDAVMVVDDLGDAQHQQDCDDDDDEMIDPDFQEFWDDYQKSLHKDR